MVPYKRLQCFQGDAGVKPPLARRIHKELETAAGRVVDNLYWLRDDSRSDPHVLAYLSAENSYADTALQPLAALAGKLANEMESRLSKVTEPVPVRHGRISKGNHGKSALRPTSAGAAAAAAGGYSYDSWDSSAPDADAPAQVVLDPNRECAAAASGADDTGSGSSTSTEHCDVFGATVSPDGALVAFGVDVSGSELYQLMVRNISSNKPVIMPMISGTSGDYEWAASSQGLFFITRNSTTNRPDKAWYFDLTTAQSVLLWKEDNAAFYLSLSRSSSGRFLLLASASEVTRQVVLMDLEVQHRAGRAPTANDWLHLAPRQAGVQQQAVAHWQSWLFLLVVSPSTPNGGAFLSDSSSRGAATAWAASDQQPVTDSVELDIDETVTLLEATEPGSDDEAQARQESRSFLLIRGRAGSISDGNHGLNDRSSRPEHGAVTKQSNIKNRQSKVNGRQNEAINDVQSKAKSDLQKLASAGGGAGAAAAPTANMPGRKGRQQEQLQHLPQLASDNSWQVAFEEDAYSVSILDSGDWASPYLRLSYTSFTTPHSIIDIDMLTQRRIVRSVARVGNGFRSEAYRSYRLWALAADGVSIPLSLVYRLDMFDRNGLNPALLMVYGAYGTKYDPEFDSRLLALLDRGWVVGIAHVRGGGELGYAWHAHGRLAAKVNSFTDLVACAQTLIAHNLTSPSRLAVWGRSAGALTAAAAMNAAPELFHAALLDVPFLDVLGDLVDVTLPLTVKEWEEWGDPLHNATMARVIRGYSPVHNVMPGVVYPHMMLTAGLMDKRVGYWEAAKWVAELRAKSHSGGSAAAGQSYAHASPAAAGQRLLLLRTDMSGGHFSAGGSVSSIDEAALKYAFLMATLPSCGSPQGLTGPDADSTLAAGAGSWAAAADKSSQAVMYLQYLPPPVQHLLMMLFTVTVMFGLVGVVWQASKVWWPPAISPADLYDLVESEDIDISQLLPPAQARHTTGPLTPLELPRLEHTCAVCFPACVGDKCLLSLSVTYPKGGSVLGTDPPYPLAILCGGFTVTSASYRSTAARLASWGYTVVRYDTRDDLFDVLDDVTCVRLLKDIIDWASTHPLLRRLADTRRIYMVGHSRGGKLATLTAAADPRVAALGLLDPVDVTKYAPLSDRFPSAAAALERVAQSGRFLPVAVIGSGLGGECAPELSNYHSFFEAAPGAAWQLLLPSAGHFQYLDATSALQRALCGSADSSPDDAAVRALSQAAMVAWGEAFAKPAGTDVLSCLAARCRSLAAAQGHAGAGAAQLLFTGSTRQEVWAQGQVPSPAHLQELKCQLAKLLVAVDYQTGSSLQALSEFKNFG
eukprot:gene3058-3338_t